MVASIRAAPEHALRRRLWQRAFTTETIKSYEGKISERASQLADLLKSEAEKNGSVDLTRWISYFTFDFMGDMACVLFCIMTVFANMIFFLLALVAVRKCFAMETLMGLGKC